MQPFAHSTSHPSQFCHPGKSAAHSAARSAVCASRAFHLDGGIAAIFLRNNNRWNAAPSHAHAYPCLASGNDLNLFPVTAKIALHTAGNTGGSAGSPNPVGGLSVFKKLTSISA